MNISIDGGGLCAPKTGKFGNYTFTKNIIQALHTYDKRNTYSIYSFCRLSTGWKFSPSWQYKILLPTRLWMKLRVSIEEFLHPKDVFLGLNQAIPIYSSGKVISFSHGLSYYYFPHHYRESYARLSTQLVPLVKNSSYIVVSSKKVKKEMNEAYPWYKHIVVLPFGVPFDMPAPDTDHTDKHYFLYVGMNHPVKNLRFLINIFSKFNAIKKYKEYKLILVGPSGLKKPKNNNIRIISEIKREELRTLYREATAYCTTSLYESFNYPVLEALSQDCPVAGLSSAIVPELEPFTTVVSTKEGFLQAMISFAEGRYKKINQKKLRTVFSWKKYVQKLLKLYY